MRGFEECTSPDPEPGFEKVAVFENEDGEACHVAKLLRSGRWSSKLGKWEDIEHSLPGLEGPYPAYGRAVTFMRKPLP
jgi:hypothetical protein